MGDLALQQGAETLGKGRRQGDVCGRYGGEEFILVVAHVSAHEAERVAERHRRAVSSLRFVAHGGPERITISIGVAAGIPGEVSSHEVLLAAADKALYEAKRAGRNRVGIAGQLFGDRIIPPAERNPAI